MDNTKAIGFISLGVAVAAMSFASPICAMFFGMIGFIAVSEIPENKGSREGDQDE